MYEQKIKFEWGLSCVGSAFSLSLSVPASRSLFFSDSLTHFFSVSFSTPPNIPFSPIFLEINASSYKVGYKEKVSVNIVIRFHFFLSFSHFPSYFHCFFFCNFPSIILSPLLFISLPPCPFLLLSLCPFLSVRLSLTLSSSVSHSRTLPCLFESSILYKNYRLQSSLSLWSLKTAN